MSHVSHVGLRQSVRVFSCHSGFIALCKVSRTVTVLSLHCVRVSVCLSSMVTGLLLPGGCDCRPVGLTALGLLHCVRVSVSLSGSIALCTCLGKSQWVMGLLHCVCVSGLMKVAPTWWL